MNKEILKALQTVEPELRKLAGDATNATFTITLDQNGTHYSVNINDNAGGAETYGKRVPRKG